MYIYTPIIRSFNKLTFHKAMIATAITFLIAGLWHGASWMFVIFGGLHGIGLIINHYWKKTKIKLNIVLAWFVTFNYVNITFVFFRAKEWNDAVKVLGSMFSLDNIVLPSVLKGGLGFLTDIGISFGGFVDNISGDYYTPVWLLFAFVLVLIFKNSSQKISSFKLNYKTALLSSIIFISAIPWSDKVSEFLYFNF